MWKALALKELRETAWIGGIAAAVLAYYVIYATGYDLLFMQPSPNRGYIPFFFDQLFIGPYFFVAVACALALGFRQSAWESIRGTYVFLIHRPISREGLFGIKLAVGLGLHLAVTGLAILAFALWAAVPGTHASPFYWSMTSWEWMVWLSMSVLYFAAFLSGIRDARWYGTRLFPLLAAVPVVMVVDALPVYWVYRVALVVATNVLYVAAIFHVVRNRDYP